MNDKLSWFPDLKPGKYVKLSIEDTGTELFNELKRFNSDIPVIICTGYSDKIDEKTASRMGIDGFVNKPITGSEIAQIIREVLDKK